MEAGVSDNVRDLRVDCSDAALAVCPALGLAEEREEPEEKFDEFVPIRQVEDVLAVLATRTVDTADLRLL